MRPIENWNGINGIVPGEYKKVPAGGYVCCIVSAKETTSSSQKRMLTIGLDIAEGEYSSYYTDDFKARKERDPEKAKWGCTYYQNLEGKGAEFFKGLITLLEVCNPGYTWDWDEHGLRGKQIGVIFREEEYIGNDGKLRSSVKPVSFRMVDDIREGNFKVPEIKRVDSAANVFGADNGEEIPF